jgi:hypothetical protein
VATLVSVDIVDKLTEHLKKFNSAPFLFVGSGFSRRYLALEDWEGLLRRFAKLLPKDFDYYAATGRKKWDVVAKLMAEDFYEIWWTDDRYKESREEFKGKIDNIYTPLKIEISKYLREKRYEEGVSERLDHEINEMKKIVIDGIITTNWDLLLEQIFEDEFYTYVGQEELLFSNPKEVGEIYKIHGSCSDPNSLVLTDEDYADFNDRNAYLAAKLMTIFIEHPIIFIGYSLSDENILGILEAITACLTSENLNKLKDRLIFVQRDERNEGDMFQVTPMVLKKTTLLVTTIRTNDFGLIYKALSKNTRKFSAKMMRQMKTQIYELIKTNDPRGRIAVIDENNIDDFSEAEFVIGVGISDRFGLIGYTSISANELFKEVILDTKKYDYVKIVTQTLPEALKRDRFIPVYKYVKKSEVPNENLDQRVIRNLKLRHKDFITQTNEKMMDEISGKFSSIQELLEEYGLKSAMEYIPLLDLETIDHLELKNFIQRHLDLLEDQQYRGNLRKLIRFYDWLVFGKN